MIQFSYYFSTGRIQLSTLLQYCGAVLILYLVMLGYSYMVTSLKACKVTTADDEKNHELILASGLSAED